MFRIPAPAFAPYAARCSIVAADYPVDYLGDTVEALIEAGCAGAKIVEHPIAMTPRIHGERSAGSIASLWYVLRLLVAIELQHKRRNTPLRIPGDCGP
jgi:hypothetical protein